MAFSTEPMPVVSSPRRSELPNAAVGAIGCILLVLAIVQIYFRVYSGFPIYDSEGATLLNARNLFKGVPLYDQIYSLYGPFYYMLQWMTHAITGSPETLDAQRFISLCYWLLSTSLFAWLTYRLSRSLLASAFVFVLFFRILTYMAQEPGHPQEFCTVALAAAGLAASYLYGRRQGVALGVLAFMVGALGMSKVNEGVFVFLAAALAVLSVARNNLLRVYGFGALAIAGLLLPYLLMRPLL